MSRRSGLLDIEPLGEDRRQAIKARVFDALDRERTAAAVRAQRATRRRWPWALGLAVAAAAAAVLVLVVVSPGDDATRSGPLATRVTTDDQPSAFRAGDARLTALPRSTVVVSGDDERGTQVTLERGAVTCEVAPRAGRPPFRVLAGEVEVAVTGTVFTVRREGRAARVEVAEGVVEVRYRGATRRLGAGESWAPDASAGESAAASEQDEQAEDAREAAQAPEPEKPARPHRRDRRSHRPRTGAAEVDDARAETPVEMPVEAPAGPSAKERYETAARLERTDPERSVELYAELVNEGGAWAATALFAQGRLEYERGRVAQARRLLQRYLRSHGAGPNAVVARKLLEDMEK